MIPHYMLLYRNFCVYVSTLISSNSYVRYYCWNVSYESNDETLAWPEQLRQTIQARANRYIRYQTMLTLPFPSQSKLNQCTVQLIIQQLTLYTRMTTIVIMNIGTFITNDDYSRHGHHWLNSALIFQGHIQLPLSAYGDRRVCGPLLPWTNR